MTPFAVLLTRVGALAGEPRTVRLIFVMVRASEDAVTAVRERYPDWIVEPTGRRVGLRHSVGSRPGQPI